MTEPQLPPALARLASWSTDGYVMGPLRHEIANEALTEARTLLADRDRLAGELEEARAELADTRVMSRIWSEDGNRERRFLAVVKRLWRERTKANRDRHSWHRCYTDLSVRLALLEGKREAHEQALTAEREAHRQTQDLLSAAIARRAAVEAGAEGLERQVAALRAVVERVEKQACYCPVNRSSECCRCGAKKALEVS